MSREVTVLRNQWPENRYQLRSAHISYLDHLRHDVFAGCAIGAMNGKKVRTRKGLTRVWNSIPSGVQAVIRFRRKWNNHPGGTFEDWWPEWHPYPHLKNQKPE